MPGSPVHLTHVVWSDSTIWYGVSDYVFFNLR